MTVLLLVFAFGFGSVGAAQSTLAGGGAFTLVVKSDGTVWAFGLNNNGQLGDNSLTTRKTAQQISGLSSIQSVAAGSLHSMALTTGGALYVWGDNLYGQVGDASTTDRKTPVLLSLSNVVAIAAGEFHSLALTSSGDVYAWGRNNFGQIGNGGSTSTNVTSPTLVLTGVVAIGAGRNHSLAVKSDGTAWAWGANGSGQLGNNTTSTGATSLPVQMQGITAASMIAGGEAHTLVILSDGTLKGAGENGAGQLADTTSTDRLTAITIGSLTNVAQVVSGLDHVFARLTDGTVWGWGENSGGELGLGPANLVDQHAPVSISALSAITAIAAGWSHSITADTNGVVSTWGANASSQLGDGTAIARSTPTPISDTSYAWRVATPTFNPASGTFNADKPVVIAVDTVGATIHYTQNGADPTESDPTVASGGSVTVTYSQTLKAKAWKTGMPAGEVGIATIVMQVATPTTSPAAGTYTTAQNVTMSTTTPGATLRYTTDGTDPTETSTAYTGAINVAHTTTFRIAGFKSGWTTSSIKVVTYTMNFGTLAAPTITPAGGAYTGSVSVSMSSTQSGATIRYTTNNTAPTTSSTIYAGALTVSTTTTVRAKAFHPDYTASSETSPVPTYTMTTATPTLGTASGAYAPGSTVTITGGLASDTLRMTIDGSDPTTTSPQTVSGTTIFLGNFTLKVKAWRTGAADSAIASAAYSVNAPLGPGSASAGGTHSVIATPDGRVMAWGENSSSQLGNESTVDKTTPFTLNSLTGVTAVSAGITQTLARTWDGQVYAWGSNGSGRLGDGTNVGRNKPTHITALSNIVAIAAGDAHGLALTSDGHVYAWGENGDGQLGIGSTTDTFTPTQIPSLSNVVAIAAGDNHSLAVTSSGQLYAWGDNLNGQIGDGTSPTDRTTPVLVNLSNVVAVAAGDKHSIAMTQNGAVYTWGLGTSGQLGRGNTSSTSTPTVISGLYASAIAAGDLHSAALRTDGVLVAWGANASGQIGDSTTTTRTAPVVVSGPANVSTLSLGDVFSIAVTPDGDVWTWGAGASGQLGDGGIANRSTPQSVLTGISSWAPSAPTLSLTSGTYATAQSVTVTSPIAGASIRYTLAGADPMESDAEVTSGSAVDVPYSAFFRARVFVSGREPGKIARADYELQSGAPTIDPPTGTYSTAQTVTMTAGGPPSVIRYTVDGSDPTSSSTAYSQSFIVSTGQTIKARAFPTNGWPASAAATSILTFNYGQLAIPSATPSGGVFGTPQSVALSAMSGATIRYTTNGSDPTATSTAYVSAISVSSGTVHLKARAFHPDWSTSDAMDITVTIDTTDPTIAAHRFPAAINSWHLTPVTVTFSCSDNAGIASCSAPITISTEGPSQPISGTAVDLVGRQATVDDTVNVDLTPPVVTMSSPSNDLLTTNAALQVIGQASDGQSGLSTVKCNDVVATVVDGAVSCALTLRPGRNAVSITALDVAGHSTSVGATVTLVGTPTRFALTPSDSTIVIAETTSLSLLDDFGAAVTGATWSSSNNGIVSLSNDDPPLLSAGSAGQATITAVKNSIVAQATITVLDAVSVPEGAKRWVVASSPIVNLQRDPPIYTTPVDADGPEAFIVETDSSSWERNVRAVTSTGEVKWMAASPGVPLMGDVFGGLIAGVEPAPNTCRAVFGEFENCYSALVRFAGPENSAVWRYSSPGLVDRPAQGQDGTLYFIEHVGSHNKSVIALNGQTGAVTARVPLANLISDSSGCQASYSETEPVTTGPIVGTDGVGYLAVTSRIHRQNVICVQGQSNVVQILQNDIGMSLLQLSSQGIVSSQAIDQCSGTCTQYSPQQLMPDGIGGTLLVSRDPSSNQQRLTRVDSEGRTDTPLAAGTRIELIGMGGTAYLHTKTSSVTSTAKDVIDVKTGTVLWSLPLDWNWIAATPNQEAFAQRDGEMARFGAGGMIGSSFALGLISPMQTLGSWLGNVGSGWSTTDGLTAVAAPFDNGTQWDVSYLTVGTGFEVPARYGDQAMRSLPQLVFHTNYNAIEIETTKTPDQIFDTYVRTFAGVNAGSYATADVPNGQVSSVGERVTFTMRPFYIRFFQDPFQVEVIRYSAADRTIAVRTINPVHPLFGWRYWHVFASTNGVTIETGAYDRPASGVMNFLGSFVAHEDQVGIWREYMDFVVQNAPGVLRSPVQLMNGIWDVDRNLGGLIAAPNGSRNHILTEICGTLPADIPWFELNGACQ
jgi:alpha-tubulin suppressor-like RCC1 family protein